MKSKKHFWELARLPEGRFTGLVRQTLCVLCAPVLILVGVAGCGDFKPPTFGEIVGSEDGSEEEEAKATPPPAVVPNPDDSGDERRGLSGRGKGKMARVKVQSPKKFIAEFDENGSKIGSDDELENLAASLGDRTDLVTKLDLSSSTVRASGMQLLEKFTELVDLNLTNVSLTSAGWEPLAKLSSLEKLNLSRSSMTNEDLGYISGLVQLKELNLSNIKEITDEGHLAIEKIRGLEVLNISMNKRITGRGFAELRRLGSLHGLKELSANNTQFGKVGMFGIRGLQSLEVLNIGNATVDNEGMKNVGGCKKLKWLAIGFNGVTDQGMAELKRLRELEHLELRNLASVTDRGLSQVKNNKSLMYVDLDGTGASMKGVKGMQKKVPGIKIKFQNRILE